MKADELVVLAKFGLAMAKTSMSLLSSTERSSLSDFTEVGRIASRYEVEDINASGLVVWDDVELIKEEESLWVTVDSASVYIKRNDEGLSVDIYPLVNEAGGAIAGAWVTWDELEE